MEWKSKKNSVLVPFVPSPASIQALEVAATFVDKRAHINVVHVIPPAHVMTPGIVYGAFDMVELEARAATAVREELDKHGFSDAQITVLTGEPASSIHEVAKQCGAELIVIPSHNRSGFERWFLGSVAEYVLRDAPCPVLVLKIQEEKK
jgi:nucleotide-binding universal stress UspA family protein